MRLLDLYIENVFSISTASLSLSDLGAVLITGYSVDENTANGAGKSSVANKAILWGLFGQTAGGLRGDAVVNRHTGGQALVQILFQGNDGNEYLIQRTRNPNGLKLVQNGNDISRKLEKDTQQLIELALGRTFETFVQTDFFGQGKFASYLALPSKDQKQVLENILSLDKLSLWTEKTRALKSKTAEEKSKSELELEYLSGRKLEIVNNKQLLSNKIFEWENKRKDKLALLNSKLLEEKNNLNTILNKKTKLQEEINDLETIKPQLIEEIRELDQIIINYDRDYKNLIINDLPNKKAQKIRWEQYKANLNSFSDRCPTCNGPIDKEHISKELQHADLELASIDFTLDNVNKSANGLLEYIVQLSSKLKAKNKILENLDQLKLQLNYINTNTVILNELESQIEQLTNEANPYTSQLESIQKSLEEIEPKIETTQSNIVILNSRIEALSTWASIFSRNFYAYVLNKACPYLEQRTAKHLQGLRNSQLKVKFQATKELKSGEIKDEFNVRVCSETGGAEFDSLSGGEQQLVSFATGLALSDLAETQVEGKSNILILDEPFVELDSKNQECVIDYINTELLKQKETILIISNDEHLKSLIPTRVHMVKEHGISRVELYV